MFYMKKLLLLIGIVSLTFTGCMPFMPFGINNEDTETTTEAYVQESTTDAGIQEDTADKGAGEPVTEQYSQYTPAANVVNTNFYKVSASSQLGDQGAYNYSPYNVIDGNTATAWVEGVSGTGEGEWISLQSDIPQTVRRIGIYNGYGQNNSVYAENGKLNSAMITFSDNTSEIIYFNTPVNGGFEYFDIGEKVTTSVTITLLSCSSGSKYEDTCISEIRIY